MKRKITAKEKLLKRLGENYCRLMYSGERGIGIFAMIDIPKSVNPFPNAPKPKNVKLSKKDISVLPEPVRRAVSDFFVFHGGYYNIPHTGLDGLDISFYINHSDSPNVRTKDGETFRTLRRIRAGEELTSDYATYDEGDRDGF